MKKSLLLLALVATTVQCNKTNSMSENTYSNVEKKVYYYFNKNDELIRPKDYRTWFFAGTVTTPESLNPNQLFPDFQNVYIDPDSYEFWRENGYFREGTIMVKELLRQTSTTELPIGTGFVQGRAYDIAVTIKDTVKFPDVPGGWEYYHFYEDDQGDFTDLAENIGRSQGCIACHSKAEAGYGPFPEYYAPLRDAKGIGKENPENFKNHKNLASNKLENFRDLKRK